MSKRFLRWIETWIEDNVRSGDGGDLESFEARARRLAERLLGEAKGAGLLAGEIEQEAGKVHGLVTRKLGTPVEFDLSTFGGAPED